MRLGAFATLGGTELANDLRTTQYIKAACLPLWNIPLDCECESYDTGPYGEPTTDPAPWYSATDTRSAEFMGLLLDNIRLLDAYSRQVTPRGTTGAALGPLRLGSRVVTASGLLVASSCEGMSYGERWVSEVLRGRVCAEGCTPDDLCLAVHCDAGGIRMLRSAGVVDGPVFDDASTPHDCTVQRVSFQLASQMPYLYSGPDTLQDAVTLLAAGSTTDLVSTDEWVADATMRFVLTAGDTDATDIRITMRVSLEGTCPDLRVAPCFDVTISTLPANSVLTIDGTTQMVVLRDPLTLRERSGLHLLEFLKAFVWPDVPPCSDVCVTVENDGAQAITLTVESWGREV